MEQPQTPKLTQVLVLDFGSQYTHLLNRRIRELAISSRWISGSSPLKTITSINPRVIILSGGPNSVHSKTSPKFPVGFVEYVAANRIFVLGICYGMQLIVHEFGGEVRDGKKKEYGRTEIVLERISRLYALKPIGSKQSVLMSHEDEVVKLPMGFTVVARSRNGLVAAVENSLKRYYGVQYHPETTHSPEGMEMLRHFLFNVCRLTKDKKIKDVLEEQIKVVKNMVQPEDHVICALSGGVDSAVAATLVHMAIGDRLHCIFVDNGLLRYKERDTVMETFERDLHLPVTLFDAKTQFLDKLKGIEDPETKRKIIGREFISIFDEFAQSLEKKLGKKIGFLVQGTMYSDVIESCVESESGRSHCQTIKSHHNVGGLPGNIKFKLIEPLKLLFKDEVRELGKILQVPEAFLKRHPFPGPGLAVRVLGDITKGNALDTLRQVDEIFIRSIKNAGLYDSLSQAFAVFLPIKSVGAQGDQRTHSHVVALRAITTDDGMTADWYNFDHKFLNDVVQKICNSVGSVNRVVLDITPNPPATTEWE